MKHNLIHIIETVKPMFSWGITPVIRIPETDLAVKYSKSNTEPSIGSSSKDIGNDMFTRHLRAYLLDEFFVKTNEYLRNHVPEPLECFNLRKDNSSYSGYIYKFTEGIEKFDTEYEGMYRQIDEWNKFQLIMKEAGFDFSTRNFDEGAWAGNGSNYEDIIYFGKSIEEKFTNEWVIIDFCTKHARFCREDFNNYTTKNKEELKKALTENQFNQLTST